MTSAPAVSSLTPAVFQKLYQQYSGELCAYLTRSLRGDVAEAEGIVQDAFLKAWEKRAELRNPKAFRSWLYTIALNVLRQRKRKLRPVVMEEIKATCERPLPETHVEMNQELERVLAALDTLSEEHREAILLVRVEFMQFNEAAEVLGVPINTVKSRVRRGMLKLAKELVD